MVDDASKLVTSESVLVCIFFVVVVVVIVVVIVVAVKSNNRSGVSIGLFFKTKEDPTSNNIVKILEVIVALVGDY